MTEPGIAIDASRATATARTGTEWYSYELIRAIARLEVRPPLVLYSREGSAFAPLRHLDRERIVNLSRLWTHVGLSAALVRDRPAALFVPSHVIPLLHPRVSVVTIHDLGFRFQPEAHPRTSRLMLDLTTRWNARVARRIIAISAQTRDDLVHEYGVDPPRITVIHSGVNQDRFRPIDPQPALQALNLTPPYLLFLSTVQPRKNVVRLLEAFEALDRPDLTLVIAGKTGWLSEPIEDRIARSPARGRIVRTGHVPDDIVPGLYSGAAAFVLPSLYEGFGLGILEAMACGCPVVTSNVSSMPEVAGDAAVLVDPTDVRDIRAGIERALSPEERSRLIDAGLRRATQFTWVRTARQVIDVLRAEMASQVS